MNATIESVILSGSIREKQKDLETGEWKYVIQGQTLDGDNASVVAKLGQVSRLYIVTVYED